MKKLFCQIDKKKFNPKYFMVMGKNAGNQTWEPMTFDDESKRFCWANPSDEYHPDESVEIYDRATAMYLLGESIHAQDGHANSSYRLVPIYTGFELVPQLYMIMEDRGDKEPFTPLCRGEYAPLTWANTGKMDRPAPELFELKIAQRLVALQKQWENENNSDQEDRLSMVIVPMQYHNIKSSDEDHLIQLSAQVLLT